MKREVAKHNRKKTQQSVYEDGIREINNITAEDWKRAIGDKPYSSELNQHYNSVSYGISKNIFGF